MTIADAAKPGHDPIGSAAALKVEIKYLGPGDEGLFERIAPDVFDNAIDRATLSHYLGTPGHHLIVALSKGEIVGQLAAVVHRHPDLRPTELYIDEVAVTPALQRQGIADRLLEGAFALGRELGCVEAWLGTEPDNLAAKGLYERRSLPAESIVMYVFKL
jgi:ribosomal protein S18 acetylase RimI-like enzyme